MVKNIENTAYALLLELVSIPSVSPSAKTENDIAEFIKRRLGQEAYFQDNPDDLRLLPCLNDTLGRHGVFAMVWAKKETDNTVLLTGHMDVVDTAVYGSLQDLAFKPEELTKKIGNFELSPQAREDLASGDWLFGRGVADMKCGIAIELAYLMEMAKNREDLACNLAVLIVPDEENNSRGMLDAVPYLHRMQEEEGLRFLACINTEPTVGSEENAVPTVHMGSIGKINPFFFCLGCGTHVGEYYQGLSAAPIVSSINLMLDGNTAYADRFNGISYPPYGCLRQHDLREEYSASIMDKAVAFYSYLTVSKLPGDILEEMRIIARKALEDTIRRHKTYSEKFAELHGPGISFPTWEPKVMSFGELVRLAEEKKAVLITDLTDQISRDAPENFDERDKAIRLVDRLVDICNIRGPLVVIGFLPPFYPHKAFNGDSSLEYRLKAALDEEIESFEKEFSISIRRFDFFEGVSDLSYCGFKEGQDGLAPLAENLPGWDNFYTFPLQDLAALDIPAVNIGPIGKDIHKVSERLYIPYALRVLPQLIDRVVRRIGLKAGQED